MKKIFILFTTLLLLCGCTSNYKLEIKNNEFKENVNVRINKDEIPKANNNSEAETDDYTAQILDNNINALFSSDKKIYKKVMNKHLNYTNVNLNYTFNEKEFEDANSLKSCFKNTVFNHNKTYYIHAFGEFYCLYSDNLNIEIKTQNKVLLNNADEINGNTYIWHINKDNEKNVNIEFKTKKGISKSNILLICVFVLPLIFLIIFIAKIIKANIAMKKF